MSRPQRLAEREVIERLERLAGWQVREGKLHRRYRFADFQRAFAFMAAVAHEAEALDHHPEWSNVYSKVTIDLATHDAGGITVLDFTLAARCEQLAADFGARGAE
jgi:4a-hydroxytetrahydrobiopterin dehydratase